ncbi:MAG: D-glycero-beta-D-manno-heptose 1,7-bisphosphate 7-phosphatase [Pseudomonadota bacterium]
MKLVILDRDGVINCDRPDHVKSPEEWIAEPGALEAIARLNRAGWRVVIATNQSGIGRGLYDHKTLAVIHDKMLAELAVHGGHIDKIYYCPHHPDDNCHCRKPKPGMLAQIINDFSLNPDDIYFIGDAYRDIQAARAAGCKAILVATGKGKQTWHKYADLLKDVKKCANLSAAVDKLL